MEFYQAALSILEDEIELVAEDQREGHFNYYLPHCGNGIEEISGYERLVYQNAIQILM